MLKPWISYNLFHDDENQNYNYMFWLGQYDSLVSTFGKYKLYFDHEIIHLFTQKSLHLKMPYNCHFICVCNLSQHCLPWQCLSWLSIYLLEINYWDNLRYLESKVDSRCNFCNKEISRMNVAKKISNDNLIHKK